MHVTQLTDEQAWLRRYRSADPAAIPLLCFPFAGGAGSMFREWSQRLPTGIEPVGVQLPGRENRLREAPFRRMEPLVERLVQVIHPLLDRPFACYGASMGARVALSLAHALGQQGLPTPCRLFVAGSAAPSLGLRVRGWDEPDSGLVDYLRRLGGTPAELLDDPEALSIFLPTLRADLEVIARAPARVPTTLTLPIRAFAGQDDDEASPARMAPWSLETVGRFDLDVVPGGHFLTVEGLNHVMAAISRDLQR